MAVSSRPRVINAFVVRTSVIGRSRETISNLRYKHYIPSIHFITELRYLMVMLLEDYHRINCATKNGAIINWAAKSLACNQSNYARFLCGRNSPIWTYKLIRLMKGTMAYQTHNTTYPIYHEKGWFRAISANVVPINSGPMLIIFTV